MTPEDLDKDGVDDDVNRSRDIALTVIGFMAVLLHFAALFLFNVDGVFCEGPKGCDIKVGEDLFAANSLFTAGVGLLGANAFLNKRKPPEVNP